MSACLHPCLSCARHIRATETRCPFCDAAVPADSSACAPAPVAPARALSRAAILFAGATFTAACNHSALYGGPPIEATPADGGDQGTMVALYGPAPFEAPDGLPRAREAAVKDASTTDAGDAGGAQKRRGPPRPPTSG